MTVLVIGYGNGLRGDDGVGPLAAEQVEGWGLPGVESLAVHQLTPELAAAIAAVEAVWFIDACVEGLGRVKSVTPTEPDSRLDHLWNPGVLLYLAKALYGAEPIAYHLLIPAVAFGYGMELSAIARDGLAWGLDTLKGRLIETPMQPVNPTNPVGAQHAAPLHAGGVQLCTK
jgi:hydrogenase maturation protease